MQLDLHALLTTHIRTQLALHDIGTPATKDGPARPIMLVGAGQHTWWLLAAVPEILNLPVAAVIDDAVTGWCGPWPVMTTAKAAASGTAHTLILSTDLHQHSMTQRIEQVWRTAAAGVSKRQERAAIPRIVDLYRGLPAGPYAKFGIGPQAPGTQPMTRGSTTWLARCCDRIGAFLCAQSSAKPGAQLLLLGQPWQIAAAAAALAAHHVQTTQRAEHATLAITLDESLEPPPSIARCPKPAGFTGDWLNLRRGERPWFSRAIACGRPAARTITPRKMRIVLRHDHNLGDVVLSSGILPERIKHELYPDCHLTFVTSSKNWRRPQTDDTGWCADLCRHNPFIDRLVALEDFSASDLDGADLVLTIDGSGGVFDHVVDYHARHVELPPGPTVPRIYLSPEDAALAARVIDKLRARNRRTGPLVGVNMGLVADRVRGWGREKTLAMCAALEQEHRATVVWLGWQGFAGYERLRDPDGARVLSAREQAAVMACCDLHIANQGGGANMSAAVGCPTLALCGLHPRYRESLALFCNPFVAESQRKHIEIWRQWEPAAEGGLSVLHVRGLDEREVSTLAQTPLLGKRLRTRDDRDEEWSIRTAVPVGADPAGADSPALVDRYATELWQCLTPAAELPKEESWWRRTAELTLEDVMLVAKVMLSRAITLSRSRELMGRAA